MTKDNGQIVVDHSWWNNRLAVMVYDAHIGRTLRVQFRESLDGKMRHSGGGGYQSQDESHFDIAKAAAAQYVEDHLGREIIPRDEWSPTKDLRGLTFNQRQEFSKLSKDEREELVRQLERDNIDLSTDEEDD